MITALIIDDEADGRAALQLTVEKYCPEIEIKGVYETPESGIQAIREIQPDLIFLDVQMPQMSGFDLLKELLPLTFQVIFVSAYDQYAIKAIRFSALDYLLKPVDVDDLINAVKRIKEKLNEKNYNYHYQSMLNNIQLKSGKIEKLAVPSLDGIDFFNTDDIIYCSADGSYTKIYLKGSQAKLVTRNLKDFENMLTGSGFCRVHHSFLVNLKHVQKYIKGEGGYVMLTDGHHVDISRRKKEEFLALLDKL